MNVKLVKHLFFPLHEFVMRRPTLVSLSKLEKSQWLHPDDLKTFQWEKLKRLLAHAYEHVPYYRSLFKSLDIHPQEIRNEDDYQLIPLLSKELIRDNLPSLTAEGFGGRLIKYSTGGSTGEPLNFYTDNGKESAHNAAKLRCRRWWGIDVGDYQIDLWGSPIEISKQDRFRIFKDRYFLNFILLSAFDLTETSIKEYLKVMHTFQPRILYGYATVLYRFAQFCEDRSIDPGLNFLKAIVTTSEMLYDYQRKKIAEVFNRPVVNEYGCREGGYIAQECPAGNMHLAMEHVYVEFVPVDKDIKGLTEVVVTNLDGYGMPFIRYRVGDLASLKEANCSCGRGLKIMQSLQGRSNDLRVSPTGKILHGLSVIYILREIQGIRQFKVIQETRDRFTIKVVKDARYKSTDEGMMRERIGKIMGAPVMIDIIYTDEIPPEKSGKYRYVVSNVEGNI